MSRDELQSKWENRARSFRAAARRILRQRGADRQTPAAAMTGVGTLKPSTSLPKVFIGHGRSPVWRELKDFIQDRLRLDWDEFNREPAAGLAITERLGQMLDECTFALLVLTAEDDVSDGTIRARENVVHETGLFQGRLGMRKAIVLLEEGCSPFSNIHGLTYLQFQSGNIKSVFEEIRRTLERENQLPAGR